MIEKHQSTHQHRTTTSQIRMPNYWESNIEGWKYTSWILRHARNLGWEKTLVYAKATKYFDASNAEWFCEGGIFSKYKHLSSKAMKTR